MRQITLLLLVFCNVYCEESAQYLQNAVRDLRKLNYIQTLRRVDTKMSQSPIKGEKIPISADRRIQQSSGVSLFILIQSVIYNFKILGYTTVESNERRATFTL